MLIVIFQAYKSPRRSTIFQDVYPHSSLIRRARLIRRSTTNQYCEQLKKLQEDDDTLIKQILIISLKPKNSVNDLEKVTINGVSAEFVPSVDFAYPPIGKNSIKFQPAIFYPDFMRFSTMRKEDLEAYPVILTDEKGTRTFAYCYKFASKRKSSFIPIGNDDSKLTLLCELLLF